MTHGGRSPKLRAARVRARTATVVPQASKTKPVALLAVAAATVAAGVWFWAPWKTERGAPEREASSVSPEPQHRVVPVAPTARVPARHETVTETPAEKQLRNVLSRLKAANPGFNPVTEAGKNRIQGDQVIELAFSSASVTNLSALTALLHLRELSLDGPTNKSALADLSPLRGLPLASLSVKNTSVADLLPLGGMPLRKLDIRSTSVSDLTPLTNMPLTDLWLDMAMVQTKQDVQVLLEQMASLRTINDMPLALFLQQASVASSARSRVGAKPLPDKFITDVLAMPVEKQLPAVLAKLKELNPAFDGREQHKIEAGQITELYISTVGVRDIGPLRALKGLKKLSLSHWSGSSTTRGAASDLSPLRGMALTWLYCHGTDVDNLSPLHGMPLTVLSCGSTQVSDLSPLAGMPLTVLSVDNTQVTDLAPLTGMPLTVLWCNRTKVNDLLPLAGMPLKELRCEFNHERDYEILFNIRTLAKINDTPVAMWWMTAGPRPQPQGYADTVWSWTPKTGGRPSHITILRDKTIKGPDGAAWSYSQLNPAEITVTTADRDRMTIKFNFPMRTMEVADGKFQGTTGRYLGKARSSE
ncbi:MAG: leucine-rich repeat domain-containing protein [Verrucomicrobia bacterium]|nr:leucine-rich repeat domain-containing protein [Verrucomicrobiota bacterium]